MRCRNCGRAEMRAKRESYHYTACGLPHVVLHGVEVRRCPACGAHAVALAHVEDLHRRIAEAVALKPGRLTPAEVRFLRLYLGQSGKGFAARMGVSAGTVSRWESEAAPQPMGPVAERLLRLMVLSRAPAEQPPALEALDRVALGRAAPARLDLMASDKGWEVRAA